MKKLYFSYLVFFSFFARTGYCQAPSWLWAKNASALDGMQGAWGYSVATDKNQNVFECGKFDNETLTFGAYTLLNANGYSNTGYDDIFVAKYDVNGNVLWAQRAGGALDDGASCVATDLYGNAFITGWFSSLSVVMGTDTLYNPNEASEVFLAKYDANGNVLWARGPGGEYANSSDLYGDGVATDAAGNAYLLGNYNCPTIIFGSDTLRQIASVNYTGIFLVKYDPNGNVVWAKNAMTNGYGSGSSIGLDAFDNIYITGCITGTNVTFGSNTIINPAIAGNNDIFVAKYDATGNILWVKNAYATITSNGTGVTDSAGNTILTGSGDSKVVAFGTDTVDVEYKNGFLFKFDANGNVLWDKGIYCVAGSGPTNIAVTPKGSIYVTGIFYSPDIIFDSDTLTDTNSCYDIFLTKYDGSGNTLWAKSVGTTSSCTSAYGVTTDEIGDAYITGNFSGNNFIFGADTLSSFYSTVFLAKSENSTTGVNDLKDAIGKVDIYPNPNKGTFTVLLNNGEFSSESQPILEVYNLLGEKIYSANILGANTTISIPGLTPGVYLYRVFTSDGNIISPGKLVIE